MQLVRNTTDDGTCKYALLRLDKLREAGVSVDRLKSILEDAAWLDGSRSRLDLSEFVEFGEPKTEEEFFAIKLKDINAAQALDGYALAASTHGDDQLANEVLELKHRSSKDSPWCKQPD